MPTESLANGKCERSSPNKNKRFLCVFYFTVSIWIGEAGFHLTMTWSCESVCELAVVACWAVLLSSTGTNWLECSWNIREKWTSCVTTSSQGEGDGKPYYKQLYNAVINSLIVFIWPALCSSNDISTVLEFNCCVSSSDPDAVCPSVLSVGSRQTLQTWIYLIGAQGKGIWNLAERLTWWAVSFNWFIWKRLLVTNISR